VILTLPGIEDRLGFGNASGKGVATFSLSKLTARVATIGVAQLTEKNRP